MNLSPWELRITYRVTCSIWEGKRFRALSMFVGESIWKRYIKLLVGQSRYLLWPWKQLASPVHPGLTIEFQYCRCNWVIIFTTSSYQPIGIMVRSNCWEKLPISWWDKSQSILSIKYKYTNTKGWKPQQIPKVKLARHIIWNLKDKSSNT